MYHLIVAPRTMEIPYKISRIVTLSVGLILTVVMPDVGAAPPQDSPEINLPNSKVSVGREPSGSATPDGSRRSARTGTSLQSPPKTLDEALRAIRVRPGFQVDRIAAEPLVVDPIALDWGNDGSLWVVEMGDYPVDAKKPDRSRGRVRHLTDTDGDGTYDRSTIFLDNLRYPTSVTVWRRGVLVTVAPNVIYAEDTNGDGRADQVDVLYQGFGQGNPQHQVNGLRWGLDNWLHLANGDEGGTVRSVKTGATCSIAGRDLRIRPDNGAMDRLTGPSQCGRARDDWGNWFGTRSEQPLVHFALAEHRLRRNRHGTAPEGRVDVVPDDDAVAYPISQIVSHWEGYEAPRPGDPHAITAACSSIVYRDDLFGEPFRENTFTCDPALNLILRRVLQPRGASFTSTRAEGEKTSEFLASTDVWFRPTSVRTGPDGALWITDMVRQVIEHPEWIDDDAEKRIDLFAGHDKGRIYRVRPVHRPLRPLPNLDTLATAGLVAALDSPNGWQRDRVQQMLLWRADPTATRPLRRMATDSALPQARLHALCTLAGTGTLTANTLTRALADSHPAIRRHAVRLVETLATIDEPTAVALLRLAKDRDPHVQMETAYALGAWNDPRADAALAAMAVRHADDPYRLAAVFSSLNEENIDQVLASVFLRAETTEVSPRLFQRLLGMAAAMGDQNVLIRVLEIVARPSPETRTDPEGSRVADWQLAALGRVLDAMERRSLTRASGRSDEADRRLRTAWKQVEPIMVSARKTTTDASESLRRRLIAVDLLGRGADLQEDLRTLGQCLVPQVSIDLQRAVVERLGALDDSQVPAIATAGWKSHSPALRRAILDMLLTRTEWQATLLDLIAGGSVPSADVDPVCRAMLRSSDDRAIAQHAERVWGPSPKSDRAAVVAQYAHVLAMSSDPKRGAAIYQRRCGACHPVAGRGRPVGPDLATRTDRSPQSLLRAILDPNRSVRPRYKSYTALTDRGRLFVGVLADESSHSITLVDREGVRRTIPRSQLDALTASDKSLMPEGLEKDLSAKDLADVIAYVAQLRPNGPARPDASRAVVTPSKRGVFRLPADGTAPMDRAVWTVDADRLGRYAVFVRYAMPKGAPHNRLEIEAGGCDLVSVLANTVDGDGVDPILIGTADLVAGRQSITIRARGPDRSTRPRVECVWFVPIGQAEARLSRREFDAVRPRLLAATEEGDWDLPVTASAIYGKAMTFSRKEKSLGIWSRQEERVVWTLEVKDEQAGVYFVYLDYACHAPPVGSRYRIEIDGQALEGVVAETGDWSEFRATMLGRIRLVPGVHRLTFRCSGASGRSVLDLRGVKLIRIPQMEMPAVDAP